MWVNTEDDADIQVHLGTRNVLRTSPWPFAKNGFSNPPGAKRAIEAAVAGSGREVHKFWYPRTR